MVPRVRVIEDEPLSRLVYLARRQGPNQPPNNWTSLFGGSAWQWSGKTDQYYYHFFYPQQPDLNWRNPKVENAIFDVTRFWYKRGVVGFRLDAVDTLFEDPNLNEQPDSSRQRCLRRAQPGSASTTPICRK